MISMHHFQYCPSGEEEEIERERGERERRETRRGRELQK